MYSWCSIT
uniref:Uncharacterized protein n=1 Tax=Arundo donax TaxID=35708 RepID=A0A0A8ZKS3_ARUDO